MRNPVEAEAQPHRLNKALAPTYHPEVGGQLLPPGLPVRTLLAAACIASIPHSGTEH